DFDLQTGTRAQRTAVTIKQLVVAGWTGRDPVAVEKHIRELEELGVKRPASKSNTCCSGMMAGSGSALAPIIRTGRWRPTGSRCRSRCATSRWQRSSGPTTRWRRIGPADAPLL